MPRRRTANPEESDSAMESAPADDEPAPRKTRSSAAAPAQPKQATRSVTAGNAAQKPQVRATSGATKAKQVPQPSAPSKPRPAAKQSHTAPKPTGKAINVQDPARGLPKSAKKKASSHPLPADSSNSVDRGDDSDVAMGDTTASGGRAKGNAQLASGTLARTQSRERLKRKSSARSVSGTMSAAEDVQSDGSGAPQAKKTKAASAKHPGARGGPRSAPAKPPSQSPSSTMLNLPITRFNELSAAPEKSAKAKKGPAPQKTAVVAAQKVLLEKENAGLKALLAAKDAEVERLKHVNLQTQQELASKTYLIPRPPGERGKNGWNLQTHMGLEDEYDTYSNIRRCVRYAVYESQLDIWKKITHQNDRAIFTCYSIVKKRFPFMAQFENNWATREFIKGICQNARRHCRKKGIEDPTLPKELLSDGDGDGDGDEDGDEDEDDDGDEDGDDDTGRTSSQVKAPSRAAAKAKAKAPAAKSKNVKVSKRKAIQESQPESEDEELGQDREDTEDGEDSEVGENGEYGEDVDGEDVGDADDGEDVGDTDDGDENEYDEGVGEDEVEQVDGENWLGWEDGQMYMTSDDMEQD